MPTTSNSGGGISSEKRELIRSIFNIVNMEIVKRARPSSVFNFSRASIGNLFLTGARVLTGSLESAVYLLATICSVPEHVRVVAAINSNFTHHISAGLADGSVITGQNSISHPSAPTALPDDGSSRGMMAGGDGAGAERDVRDETAMLDLIEDATLPGSLPTLRKPYITFNKGGGAGTLTPILSSTTESSRTGSTRQHTPITTDVAMVRSTGNNIEYALSCLSVKTEDTTLTSSPTSSLPLSPQDTSSPRHNDQTQQKQTAPALDDSGGEHPLPSRIDRIWYINPYGHEIWPPANPKVTSTLLGSASAVIYSIGSLYTSIVPSLVLRGVGAALAESRTVRHKVLILNSSLDRETSGRAFRSGEGSRSRRETTGSGEGDGVEGEVNSEQQDEDFTAADFIRAIVRACVQSQGELPARMARRSSLSYKVRPSQGTSSSALQPRPPTSASTTPAAPEISVSGTSTSTSDDAAAAAFFDSPFIVRRYVTHLVYLEAPGAPRVDKAVLARMGVECVRVYGRREGGSATAPAATAVGVSAGDQHDGTDAAKNHGGPMPNSKQGPLRYDIAGLTRALEAIVVMGPGGGGEKTGLTRSRRNTSGQ